MATVLPASATIELIWLQAVLAALLVQLMVFQSSLRGLAFVKAEVHLSLQYTLLFETPSPVRSCVQASRFTAAITIYILIFNTGT